MIEKNYGNVKVVWQKGKYGVTDLEGNIIVPFGKYAWIDGFDHGLARVHSYGITKIKNGECHQYKVSPLKIVDGEIVANPEYKGEKLQPSKWGIINEKGEEVLPMEYDNIWNFMVKTAFQQELKKMENLAKYIFTI